MSRFFVERDNIDKQNNQALVEGREAHHIIDVMRMKETDEVVIFDGTGNEYTGYIDILDAKKKKIIVKIVKMRKPGQENHPEIYLAQAIPKKEKMDYIVQKSTELGIKGIIPLVTGRTIVRPDLDSSAKKSERWKKISIEAAKQCGRIDVPVIGEIKNFTEFMSEIRDYDMALMAALAENAVPLKQTVVNFIAGKILVMIGPEGDFTPEEINLSMRNNCHVVSLGRRVLKSDTAGLFILSALVYEFSDEPFYPHRPAAKGLR